MDQTPDCHVISTVPVLSVLNNLVRNLLVDDVRSKNSALAKALSTPKFIRWFGAAALEWSAIVIIYVIAINSHSWLIWAVSLIILGSRQHALGVLGHDAAHFTAAKDRKLNDFAGEIFCFWPLLTGLHDFRRFHFNHHRYFNTGKDPELLFKNGWSAQQWSTPRRRSQIIMLFLGDLIGLGVLEVLKAFYLMGKTRPRSVIGPLLWWTCIGGVLYAYGLGIVIVTWVTAILTSFWGFFRLRTWTEHVGSDDTHAVSVNWWQKALITPHCSWTHGEHHHYPSVPFWQRHHLRNSNDNSLTFMELLSSFEN